MMDEFTLKVTPQELQVIVAAMHEAPYKIVAPLLVKMQAQITEQEAEKQTAAQSESGAA